MSFPMTIRANMCPTPFFHANDGFDETHDFYPTMTGFMLSAFLYGKTERDFPLHKSCDIVPAWGRAANRRYGK